MLEGRQTRVDVRFAKCARAVELPHVTSFFLHSQSIKYSRRHLEDFRIEKKRHIYLQEESH